jgi:hypothetical protein
MAVRCIGSKNPRLIGDVLATDNFRRVAAGSTRTKGQPIILRPLQTVKVILQSKVGR